MSRDGWDPLRELAGVQRRMNSLFEGALAGADFDANGEVGAWSPPADVHETPGEWCALLEIPGVSGDRIGLRVDHETLIVEGEAAGDRDRPGEMYHRVERSHGKFVRRLPFPSDFDADSIVASYRDGVLTVRAPRRDGPGARSYRVTVR